MSKRVVIKMRNMKKLLGNELLQLALMLSLMRVDPEGFLNPRTTDVFNHTSGDSFNDDVWTLTQDNLFSSQWGFGGGGDLSPRLHPKSMDSMLERLQTEILDDLNNLGHYSRIRSYRGDPVEISAYVVTDQQVDPTPASSIPALNHDSDSGISDTEMQASSSGSDSEESGDEDRGAASPEAGSFVDLNDAELELVVDPRDVFGDLPEIKTEEQEVVIEDGGLADFLPDPEDLENELVHIDDQLITIEDNLDVISDEFLHLDEQLAVHIEQEESRDFLAPEFLDEVAYDANPFDDWMSDSARAIEELVGEAVTMEESNSQNGNFAQASSHIQENFPNSNQRQAEEFEAPNKFMPSFPSESSGATSPSNSVRGAQDRSRNNSEASNNLVAQTDGTSSELWTGEGKFEQTSLEDLFRAPSNHPEGLLRNVSLHQPSAAAGEASRDGAFRGVAAAAAAFASNVTNSSQAGAEEYQQSGLDSLLGIQSNENEIMKDIINVFGGRDLHDVESEFDSLLKQQLQHHQDMTGQQAQPQQAANQDQANCCANTTAIHPFMDPSNWGRSSSSSDAAASNSMGIQHDESADNGAAATLASSPPDFAAVAAASSHQAAAFAAAAAGYSAANGTAGQAAMPGYSGYNPWSMAAAAAAATRYPPYTPLMNHTYAAAAAAMSSSSSAARAHHQGDEMETASHTSGKSQKLKKEYSLDSIKQDPDGPVSDRNRHSRDERKARELGVEFSIHDIINLPMDEFNDMLSRHELNEEQLNLCRDIRRRGKNKVAAQNCRKRKIDQIAQLEHQVEEARLRKQKLMGEREFLYQQREEWAMKLSVLEEDIVVGMNKNVKEFGLDLVSPDVRIVRRSVPVGGAAAAAAGAEQMGSGYHHSQHTASSQSSRGGGSMHHYQDAAASSYLWKGGSSSGTNNS